MPAEIVSTYQIWADPALWEGVGAIVIVLALIFWRLRFPESYKRAKRRVLKSGNTAIQVANILGLVGSLSILGLLALYNYSEKTIVAIQTSSPELYTFVWEYKNTVETAFIVFMILLFVGRTIAHQWNSLDNGTIDDPDQERWDKQQKFEDFKRDERIEEVERNRQLGEERTQKALADLLALVTSYEKALYRTGDRFEENPIPPDGTPERRKEVKVDPAILPTEEMTAKILPLLASVEKPILLLNTDEQEGGDVEKKNEEYGKFDQLVLGGVKKILRK